MIGILRKSASVTLDRLAGMVGWMGWGSASGVTVNERSAMDVAAFFCGARAIAEGVAQMPARVVVREYDDTLGLERMIPQRGHWAHRLFSRRPNEWQTPFEFIEGMTLCAVVGKGGIAIKNVVNGEVRELLPVPPDCWTVEQRRDWTLRIRVDYDDKTHDYFELGQVLYLRGPSLNGYEGLPVVRLAREALGLSVALERQQAKLAGNGGKPSGVLSFDGQLGKETREKLRETWNARFGSGGDGGIAVLDGNAKFFPMTMTSVDAQFLETRQQQVLEIARFLRVQPIMMMQADKAATYASAEQMFRVHVIHTLGPWVERWEQAVQRDILGVDSDLSLDLDERNLMRGDFKDQAEYYTKALGAGGQPGWLTPNEIRSEIGRNPIGDDWANTVPRGAMQPQEADNGNQTP